MRLSKCSLLGSLALLGAGCADESPRSEEPKSGETVTSRLSIQVAPLEMPEITSVCYDLQVTKIFGDQSEYVWTQGSVYADRSYDESGNPTGDLDTLCSDEYGGGQGNIVYIGTCDATADSTFVRLFIDSAWSGGDRIEDFESPCDPFCELTATCVENQDVPVVFNLTLMRQAQQGFFDIGVKFGDIFCSAKLDCAYDASGNEPVELLYDADGNQRQTAVIGLACSAGPGQDTELHVSDIRVTCGDASGNEPWSDITVMSLGSTCIDTSPFETGGEIGFGYSFWWDMSFLEEGAPERLWVKQAGLEGIQWNFDSSGTASPATFAPPPSECPGCRALPDKLLGQEGGPPTMLAAVIDHDTASMTNQPDAEDPPWATFFSGVKDAYYATYEFNGSTWQYADKLELPVGASPWLDPMTRSIVSLPSEGDRDVGDVEPEPLRIQLRDPSRSSFHYLPIRELPRRIGGFDFHLQRFGNGYLVGYRCLPYEVENCSLVVLGLAEYANTASSAPPPFVIVPAPTWLDRVATIGPKSSSIVPVGANDFIVEAPFPDSNGQSQQQLVRVSKAGGSWTASLLFPGAQESRLTRWSGLDFDCKGDQFLRQDTRLRPECSEFGANGINGVFWGQYAVPGTADTDAFVNRFVAWFEGTALKMLSETVVEGSTALEPDSEASPRPAFAWRANGDVLVIERPPSNVFAREMSGSDQDYIAYRVPSWWDNESFPQNRTPFSLPARSLDGLITRPGGNYTLLFSTEQLVRSAANPTLSAVQLSAPPGDSAMDVYEPVIIGAVDEPMSSYTGFMRDPATNLYQGDDAFVPFPCTDIILSGSRKTDDTQVAYAARPRSRGENIREFVVNAVRLSVQNAWRRLPHPADAPRYLYPLGRFIARSERPMLCSQDGTATSIAGHYFYMDVEGTREDGPAGPMLWGYGGGLRLWSKSGDGAWNTTRGAQLPPRLPPGVTYNPSDDLLISVPDEVAGVRDGKQVLIGNAYIVRRSELIPGRGEPEPRLSWTVVGLIESEGESVLWDAWPLELPSGLSDNPRLSGYQIDPETQSLIAEVSTDLESRFFFYPPDESGSGAALFREPVEISRPVDFESCWFDEVQRGIATFGCNNKDGYRLGVLSLQPLVSGAPGTETRIQVPKAPGGLTLTYYGQKTFLDHDTILFDVGTPEGNRIIAYRRSGSWDAEVLKLPIPNVTEGDPWRITYASIQSNLNGAAIVRLDLTRCIQYDPDGNCTSSIWDYRRILVASPAEQGAEISTWDYPSSWPYAPTWKEQDSVLILVTANATRWTPLQVDIPETPQDESYDDWFAGCPNPPLDETTCVTSPSLLLVRFDPDRRGPSVVGHWTSTEFPSLSFNQHGMRVIEGAETRRYEMLVSLNGGNSSPQNAQNYHLLDLSPSQSPSNGLDYDITARPFVFPTVEGWDVTNQWLELDRSWSLDLGDDKLVLNPCERVQASMGPGRRIYDAFGMETSSNDKVVSFSTSGTGPISGDVMPIESSNWPDLANAYVSFQPAELRGTSTLLDPSSGPGNVWRGSNVDEDPEDPIWQYATYRGREQLMCGDVSCNKLYWNVAIGFQPEASDCRLQFFATAGEPQHFEDGWPQTTGGKWPTIVYDVMLTGSGGKDNLVCRQNPLDGEGSQVTSEFLDSLRFCHAYYGEGTEASSEPDCETNFSAMERSEEKKQAEVQAAVPQPTPTPSPQ
jgi:hypothetical protein